MCVWHLIDSTNCNNTPTTAVDNETQIKQDQNLSRGEHRKRERERKRIDVSRTSSNFRDAKSAAIVQVHTFDAHSSNSQQWNQPPKRIMMNFVLISKYRALFAADDDDAIQPFIISIETFIKRWWRRRMQKIEILKTKTKIQFTRSKYLDLKFKIEDYRLQISNRFPFFPMEIDKQYLMKSSPKMRLRLNPCRFIIIYDRKK